MRKKFTMLLAALFLTIGTVVAQTETMAKGAILSAEQMNALEEETDVVIQNISGTNNWYFCGNKNVETFGTNNEAWFVWEPAGEGLFYLKKKYPTDAQGEGYLQPGDTGANITIGPKATAQKFYAEFKEPQNEVPVSGADAAKLVRFVQEGGERWINCQEKNGSPKYNEGQGGYTMHNVYKLVKLPEVEKEYRIKDDKSGKYLTIRSYNGDSGGAYGTVPLLERAEKNVDQVWVLETADADAGTYYLKSKSGYYLKCRGWNVDALNGGDKSAVSLEAPTVDYLNDLTLSGYSEGTSLCIKNVNKYFKSQNVGNDGGTAHPFCNCTTNDDWGNRTTWTFEEVSESEFDKILFSTDNYKFYYNIKNLRVDKYANFDGDGAFSETSELNAGSYWYFVDATSKLPAETEVPEGFIACYIFNAANGKAVQNHSNGYMNDIDAALYPAKIYYIRKHTKDDLEGYAIHDYTNEGSAWNDHAGSAVTSWGYDDKGSVWDILPVELTKDQAAGYANASKNTATTLIAAAKEASYFTYSADAIAAAEGVVNAVNTDNIFNALSGSIEVEVALNTLKNSEKTGAPAAGDVIQLKNKNYNKFLKANDADLTSVDNKNELATLWIVETGDEGNVKLKNYSTEKYIGEIRESTTVAMVESANAKQFAFTNQADVYAVFNETTGGGYAYGHIAGNNVLVGWEPGANASQWLVSNVCPLSIIYRYNDQQLGTSTTIVEKGTTYSVSSSPYDFTKVSACTKNEEALEAVDGVFSFEVTEATTLTVELADDLPFKTTTITEGQFAANTEWYVVKQHSSQGYTQTWKYDAESGVTTESTTIYTDNHLWCFAGSKDNLKIYNKVAGSSVSLTNTEIASMAAENAAVWKMVKSGAEASFAGKNPFCLQNDDNTSYLNTQDGVLKYWGSKDQGSTIMVIAHQPLSIKYMFKGEELTDLSENKLVESGSTHTITNPYANKYVNVTCAVNGNRVEAVDGQWTVNVTKATNVIVTITEDLPFKTSTSFATANWQYMQMNSSNWKYMKTNSDNTSNTSTQTASELGDDALWAFVGDALNGFQIWNKAVEGAVLTIDNSNDGTAAYMKASGDQKWTIEKGNGGFILRQGTNECLNDHGGGGVMKIWNHTNSPTGAGSAFRTISGSVADLADLCFPGVFTLQAERSPLLYDASANVADANKLSSGMASGIAANGNDANQQFLISESETDGLYYLYSVGAAKFVDAELNFTDYPQPVLSFEANEGNSVFPWFVKIGGKYVVPGTNGTAGNKIFHTETPEADAGKWYRIEKVGEDMSLTQSVALTIQYADGLLKDASQLDNGKVYAVYTYDRGAWYHNGDDALWSTGKTPKPGDAAENADHFAFLTVNGKIYLYSVGAGKFIVKSEAQHGGMYYAAYSDTPAQTVELLAATNGGWFPVVVKLNAPSAPSQLAVSNSYDYPVVMYDDLSDTGNQVRIEEIGTLDLSAVVTQIEAYQMDEEAKGGLQTLITEATTKNAYLENASLTAAITAAQAALDKVGATYDELMTAKENLAAALNSALYVTEINGFSNNYVYTFVSKRGWMGADNTDGVISGTGADDNTNYQWAVYKSSEHYYLYNIGKGQFMGVEIRNNTQMPFSATPQTTGLTFKKSAWADYPIMFSMDNQYVVNNDKNGKMICWTGGWDNLTDEGSNHKVTIVGKIESSTLTTIAAAVELYETQGVAVQALEKAIAAAQVKVDGMGEGLGYYTSTDANATATLAAIVDFKDAITGETTVAAIEAQTAAANALVETFSVNLPEAGKFYRFSYDYGADGVKYVQAMASNVSGKANAMLMTDKQDSVSIFYFADGKLLSYSAGQYVKESGDTRGLQAVGAEAGAAKFEAGSKAGKLYIFAGDSFHANKSGDICFVDHCGAGHPDQAEDRHNFTVEEVDMADIFENLKPLAEKANDVAKLDYLPEDEKNALTAEANAITNRTITSDPTARVNAMIDAAMNVMDHYNLSDQLFRLKNTASGLYMTIETPEQAAGIKIKAKDSDATKQAFYIASTAEVGVYNIKSAEGYFMASSGAWHYGAYQTANEAGRAHTVEYLGEGKYALKTLLGYAGPNKNTTDENSPLYSNHTADNNGREWELEALNELEVLVVDAQLLKMTVDANTGDEIGEYAAVTSETLAAAIETAKTKGDAATADDVAALQAVMDNTKVILPTADKYYQIYSALGFAETKAVYSDGNAPMWETLNANDKTFFWQAVATADGIALKNVADGKFLNGNAGQSGAWSVSETPANIDVKILAKDEHENGYQYGVVLNDWQMHAAGHNDGKGTSGSIVSWNAEAGSASAWYMVEVELPEFYTVVYNFKYEGATKYTQAATLSAGAEFPEFTVTLPYGVSVADERPTGTVTGNHTIDFNLKIEKALPFVAATDVNSIKTWYYVQMHANAVVTAYLEDNGGENIAWNNKSVDDSEIDSHLWGFVGDVWNGIKMVNKNTGNAIVSTRGNAVLGTAANATAFIPTISNGVLSDWFCLKYPESNYLNAQGNQAEGAGIVASYGDADNGSSLFVTEYNKEYVVSVSEVGYSTYYSDYRLAIPESVEAYVVASVENREVVLEQVTGVIPAHTGLILRVEGTHNFVTSAAATTEIETNLLKGTTTKTLITPAEGYTCYVLANPAGGNGVGLYRASLNQNDGKSFYNNANKVYLPVANPVVEDNDGQAARALRFRFGGEGTTEIEPSTLNSQPSTIIYDLTGRRILEIVEKGIYIVNGKKVVIK